MDARQGEHPWVEYSNHKPTAAGRFCQKRKMSELLGIPPSQRQRIVKRYLFEYFGSQVNIFGTENKQAFFLG